MWKPLNMRVIEELQKVAPAGLSSRHLGHILKAPMHSISCILSKLYAYGAPLEKTNGNFGPRVIWKWKGENNGGKSSPAPRTDPVVARRVERVRPEGGAAVRRARGADQESTAA